MNLLDNFSSGLMDSIGMNAESIFADIPALTDGAQANGSNQDQSFINPSSLLQGIDQAPQGAAAATPPPQAPATSKDGTQWVPGVGFVQKNTGNAAQDWEAAAGSPAPNLAAIQAHNAAMLDPAKAGQGGPGVQPAASTQRYYTRKLARAIFMDKRSSPEQVAQAHNQLRTQGADSTNSGARGLTPDATWDDTFKSNQRNNFGEGVGEHEGQKLVNNPDGSSQFKYLTDLG